MNKKYNVEYKFINNKLIRKDLNFNFITLFQKATGTYIRSNVFENGKEGILEPFMASYPHLIDVGVMGDCIHGKSGLCIKAGIQCYQNGLNISESNMTVENFEKICIESEGLVDQIALGGRGDPDCHEQFEELLKISNKYNIVPNYTTSGLLMNKEKAELSKKYCGAVAVSWYRSKYTIDALNLLLNEKVKTNIHFVVDNNSIDEAIDILAKNSLPKGINAIIFLLFKPVGQGCMENILKLTDERLEKFFNEVEKPHPFKIGFDSCFIPGIINNVKGINLDSIDTCEGGRFSMYITPSMKAVPCSFDQNLKYSFDISNSSIHDAWISEQFDNFRNVMEKSCPTCHKRNYCLGGCPLIKEIVLCDRNAKNIN